MIKQIKKMVKKIINKIPGSYCLMFHHIDDGKVIRKSSCIISYSSFVKILDSGIECITIDEYVMFSNKNIGKYVLTFDDGLKDVYTVAYPELKKRNIPFTLFVILDYLDREGYITTQELIELSKDPIVTIASHGMTHDILKGMSKEKQYYELSESKRLLQNIIESDVKYFAFSHGQYDGTTKKLLKEENLYEYAFGTDCFVTNKYTKIWKYRLPRINCNDNFSKYYKN